MYIGMKKLSSIKSVRVKKTKDAVIMYPLLSDILEYSTGTGLSIAVCNGTPAYLTTPRVSISYSKQSISNL
jgi:hypothetical protein